MRAVLVFDMDGVLAEVTDSYRETISRTVEHFTGQAVPNSRMQEYKNRGGFNNDFLLSQRLCRDLGVDVEYGAVVDIFNKILLGENFDGLILREKWMPGAGLLERLGKRFDLAIFTGRPLVDVRHSLGRFASGIRFDPVIALEDVKKQKPAPDGLNLIQRRKTGCALTYIGDTVDDARSARAAGVAFIGVASPASPRHARIVEVLRAEGAIDVVDDVNQIEGVLP